MYLKSKGEDGFREAGDLSGGLINVQVFASTGTYTKTAGTNSIEVYCTGGGGGGGGPGSGVQDCGAGGGAGGTGYKRITGGVTGITVTIGGGGAGGTYTNNGIAGQTSSFGTHVSCTGGTFGGHGNLGGVYAGYGGVATSGDMNIRGGAGCAGHDDPIGQWHTGGRGGGSYWGGGRIGSTSSFNPGAGGYAPVYDAAYGAGGGGGYGRTNEVGGPGEGGICVIWEYS